MRTVAYSRRNAATPQYGLAYTCPRNRSPNTVWGLGHFELPNGLDAVYLPRYSETTRAECSTPNVTLRRSWLGWGTTPIVCSSTSPRIFAAQAFALPASSSLIIRRVNPATAKYAP